MKRILLIIIALTILIGCGKSVPTLEDHLTLKFKIFKAMVLVAANKLDVEITEVALVERMHVHGNSQVAGYTEEDENGVIIATGIHISKSFLVNPDIILRHVGVHEVCHFYLFDQDKPSTEMAAEACVWAYVGEESFMEVYRVLYAQEGIELPSVEEIKQTLGVK